MKIYEAAERTPQLSENLLNVLENSVRAMHHFLSDTEVKANKKICFQALSKVEHLIIAGNELT